MNMSEKYFIVEADFDGWEFRGIVRTLFGDCVCVCGICTLHMYVQYENKRGCTSKTNFLWDVI